MTNLYQRMTETLAENMGDTFTVMQQFKEAIHRIYALEDEMKSMRIAMDYLLRSPVGLVPREADRFYDWERATFQAEDE